MRISDWSSDVCSSDLFTPAVATAVRDLRPDFRALSVRVHGARNMVEEPAAAAMLKAAVAGVADGPEWADAHLASWAEAYKAFGAKPNRPPCSVDALRKRGIGTASGRERVCQVV